MIINDGSRSVNFNRLRKQFLTGVKGNLIIYARYKEKGKNRIYKVISSSGFYTDIGNKKRQVISSAILNAFFIIQKRFGTGSSIQLVEILDYGVRYGNETVKIKRYRIRGKYRVGIWVKGQRGIVTSQKYKRVNNRENLENISIQEGFFKDL